MRPFLVKLAARKRTPLNVAFILAAPLYFLSLMLASMAIDRPHIIAWSHKGTLVQHFHDTAAGLEAKIWLAALIPSGLLIAVGIAAVFIRYGTYIVCAAMLVISGALPHKLDTWQRHHIARYPRGQDLKPDGWSTNLLDKGEWEQGARGDDPEPARVDDRPGDPVRARLRDRRRAAPAARQPRGARAAPAGPADPRRGCPEPAAPRSGRRRRALALDRPRVSPARDGDRVR